MFSAGSPSAWKLSCGRAAGAFRGWDEEQRTFVSCCEGDIGIFILLQSQETLICLVLSTVPDFSILEVERHGSPRSSSCVTVRSCCVTNDPVSQSAKTVIICSS